MCCANNTQGTKLFIGNLPLSATAEGLRSIAAEFGTVEEIVVLHRTSPSGNRCGFVRYSNVEMAQQARTGITSLCYPGSDVAMVARFADRTRTPRGPDHATDYTKLFVGNLSTEVTEAELWEMFAPFGEVMDIVVMRKASMSGCRCAFVRFAVAGAAGSAVDHLHGMKNSVGVPLVVRIADPGRADMAGSVCSQTSTMTTPTTAPFSVLPTSSSSRSSPHSMCSTPPLSPCTFSEASNTPPSSPGPHHMHRVPLPPVPADDAPFLLPVSMCIGRNNTSSAVAMVRPQAQYSVPTYHQDHHYNHARKVEQDSSCFPTSSVRPVAVASTGSNASGSPRWVYQHDPYSFAAFADDASMY